MSQKPDECRIYVCRCGCSTFQLREDGATICGACESVSPHNGAWWMGIAAPERSTEPHLELGGEAGFSRRRMAELAADPNAALIVVRRACGSLSVWSDCETKKQRRWATRGLKMAKRLLPRRR